MTKAVRYKSAADYVTAEIQRMILSGELKPGARVDQIELAEYLDVSRHPVRQAIERLAERGFMQLSPHRSAIVAEFSVSDMDELYSLREQLEIWAVRAGWEDLLTRHTALDEAYAVLCRTDPSENMDTYMAANRTFHLSMYQGSGNRHLLRMIVMLFDLSERYQRCALVYSSRHSRSTQDHTEMMQALLDRNLEKLVALIQRHNRGTQMTVREHIT